MAEFSLTQGVQDQKLTFLSINVSLCVLCENNKILSSCLQCFEVRSLELCPDWSPFILYEFDYDDRLAHLTTKPFWKESSFTNDMLLIFKPD